MLAETQRIVKHHNAGGGRSEPGIPSRVGTASSGNTQNGVRGKLTVRMPQHGHRDSGGGDHDDRDATIVDELLYHSKRTSNCVEAYDTRSRMFTLRLRPIKKFNEDGPLGLQSSRECKLSGDLCDGRFIVDVFEGTVLMKAMESEARRVLSRHGERLADFEFLSGQGTLENCHSSIEAIDLKYSPHRRVTMQLSASLDESEIETPHGYEHTVFEVIKDIDQGISHIFVLDLVDPTSQTSPGLLRAVVNGNEELTRRLLDQGVCVFV